jgi:uncharacterized protein (DUF1330 family)
MSQAYLIADTKIHDPEKYEAYKRLAKTNRRRIWR